MHRTLSLLLLLVLLAPAGAAGQSAAAGQLRLRPGDAVRLQVANEPDLDAEYPVVDDGSVLLPLVGKVIVAGRPFEQVRAEVRSAYDEQLVGSTVVVTPVLRIPVLGEVRSPGLLPVDPTYTLADILASAGGLTPEADRDKLFLMRGGETLTLEMEAEVGDGGIRLRPGDQILVGERSWFSRNSSVFLSVGGSVVAAVLTSLILR